MKIALGALVASVIMSSAAHAQDAAASAQPVAATLRTAVAADSEPPATGKVVFYRGGSIMGAALGCPIRYKGSEIVELGRGKFAEWTVPAGSYIVNNKTSSIELNVAAGATKYVRCQIKPGFLSGRADLQIVDEESFAEHASDFERKEAAPLVVPR